MNTELKFAFEKETKGTVRYQEVGDDGALAFAPQVGTLYVRKSAMPDGKIPNHCCHCRRRIIALHVAGWRFAKMRGLHTSFTTDEETLAEVAGARPMSYRSTTLSRF